MEDGARLKGIKTFPDAPCDAEIEDYAERKSAMGRTWKPFQIARLTLHLAQTCIFLKEVYC